MHRHIGDRVQSTDGYRGTVRYVGELDPGKGIWIGVEWDDPKRGKHNGSRKGIQYFHTLYVSRQFINNMSFREETSGSFVKEDKLERSKSFLQAVYERYLPWEASADKENGLDTVIKFGGDGVEVETVGFAKVQSKLAALDRLTDISVQEEGVQVAGTDDDIVKMRGLFKNLESLDLSANLLNNWDEVALIVGTLPKLSSLRLK